MPSKVQRFSPQTGVRASQVEEGDVEQGARNIFRPDLCVLRNGVRLGELPACADMDDGLNDGFALLMHERERGALVSDGQCELVLVHQTYLLDL